MKNDIQTLFSPENIAKLAEQSIVDQFNKKAILFLDEVFALAETGDTSKHTKLLAVLNAHKEDFEKYSVDINTTRNCLTALAVSVTKGHKEAFDTILQLGADVNAENGIWSTLIYAIQHEQPEMTKELIKRGADLTAATPNNLSVEEYANTKNKETVKAFKEGIQYLLDTAVKEHIYKDNNLYREQLKIDNITTLGL